jgi:PAS domain S-box-containing protein
LNRKPQKKGEITTQIQYRLVEEIAARKKVEEELKKAVEVAVQRSKELEGYYVELKKSQVATINILEDLTEEIAERKKVEEKLRASREYAQNIIDSSLDMIIAVNKQRRITEFNHAAEETFGYKKEEILGKHINVLYANVEEGRKVHRQTVLKGRLVKEVLNKRKNGETFPALLAASTLTDKKGRITGIMGVSRDITEQKVAEESLRTRAKQQAAVASLGEKALAETNLEQLFQYAAEMVTKILEVEYCKVLELQADGSRLKLVAGVGWEKGYVGKALITADNTSQAGYTLQTGETVIVKDLNKETRFSGPTLLKDHNVVSGLSTIIGSRKAPYGVLGAHTIKKRSFSREDVNFFNSIAHILGETIERKEATRALQEREEEFRTLIATAQDAIVGLDERGCISVWNRAATRMFGFTRQEALGQDLHGLIVPPRYRKEARLGLHRFWKTGQGTIIGRIVELTGLRKDGSEFPMELSVSKYRKGKYLYATGIIRDVSERRRAEKEREILQRLSRRLTEPLNLQQVGEVIAQETKKLFSYDAFSLEAIDEDRGLLVGIYNEDTPVEGKSPEQVPTASIPLDQVSNKVPLHGKAQLLNRKKLPRRTQTNPFGFKKRLSWSLMYAPILWESKPVGVLSIQSYTPNRYTKDDLVLLQTLANQLGGVFARLKTGKALQESEDRFRRLVETAPIGIAIYQEGKFVLVNDYMLKMTGYRLEEIINKPVIEILGLRQREQIAKWIEEMFLTRKSASPTEEQIFTKDGRILHAMVAGVPIIFKGKPAIEISAVDISGIKKTQQALKESEQKFRTLFEDSRDVIYITTVEGEIMDINKAGVKLFGYSREEILNLPVQKLYKNPNDRNRFRESISRTGYVEDFEVQLRTADGTVLDCLITASEWKNEAGEVVGYQGIIRDITEWNQARKALEVALEKAQEGERVKTLFLANVSHEIRTPLNAIIGFTDLIAQSVKDLVTPEQQSFFEAVQQSGQRLLRTVHEILEISQAEAGTTRIHPQTLDLWNLITQVVRELEAPAREKGLEIKMSQEGKAAYAHVDEYCITQALSNLVENAIKYTDEGYIELRLVSVDKRHQLTIKDTGIGMSKEYMKRMFEIFTQESEGYTKRYQGIGLGLAITKQYLDLNGVQVKVESEPEKGTTFTLWFKAVIPPERKKIEPKPEIHQVEEVLQPEEKAHKPHILVVEDDVNSQKLLQFYLRAGYEVSFAISVAGARELLKSKTVDLVLVDLSLVGNEDGLDLVRWMRKTKRWREIPVIAATAHAYESDRRKCLEAGCHDYLAKPLRRSDLLLAIQTLLNPS